MQNFTHDELSALFNENRDLFNEKPQATPGAEILNRIIGYNRALSVRKTKVMPIVRMVLN